ncbi:IgaA/UmoB family intracellular growth attenuator [Arsenophonus endosymbiont of Bemisia tabaci]|uniref:IgaA/UmoB family intracellular growth attenuator n=1 Tax=Arsenophonus endosymbiont of Bemisia tabaci TaxID=536059 RepID=UPI0015F71B08
MGFYFLQCNNTLFLINDQDNLWRYFIDSKEVHLPRQLEPYLTTLKCYGCC